MISPATFIRLKKEQAELDEFIYKQSVIQFEWVSFWNAKRLKLALLTEIAEFANELRTFKIWAKKEPVNPSKVKEELIDCLCFFLGLVNLYQIDFLESAPPFSEVEFNDLLLDFFAKAHSLALIENSALYPHQKDPYQRIKLTPPQLETYQAWWKIFQHCCQKVKIEKEEELFSIYSSKKDTNLKREK
ncbi:MAG: dUTP diphosphatase [Candidatus Moeniiplasma glomeromycotorum]|nr:dUTP diphosphatase [Candidatus Moeniiplasma glomeromycotorum]MCE8167492.1 dUTP diphosphatase [Candidatus Moeniiplasma glomeromycotorum]